MAYDVSGVTGAITVQDWSDQTLAMVGASGGVREYVVSGFSAAIGGAGARAVTVQSGVAWQGGAGLTSSAAVVLNLAANNGSTPRQDYIVAEVDWFAGATPTDRTTAGNILSLAGTPAASPLPPDSKLTRSGGSLWRQPLWIATVSGNAATGGAITSLVDARVSAGGARPFAQLNITGSTWSQDPSPGLAFGVERVGARVEMTGQITRTGSPIASGASATFGGTPIIPDGYRPKRGLVVRGVSGVVANDISEQRFIFQPDGTCTMWVTRGTLATGRVIRVDTTTYLGA